MSTVQDRDSSLIVQLIVIYAYAVVKPPDAPRNSQTGRSYPTIGAAPREGAASRPPHRGGRPRVLYRPRRFAPPPGPRRARPPPGGGALPPHCTARGEVLPLNACAMACARAHQSSPARPTWGGGFDGGGGAHRVKQPTARPRGGDARLWGDQAARLRRGCVGSQGGRWSSLNSINPTTRE